MNLRQLSYFKYNREQVLAGRRDRHLVQVYWATPEPTTGPEHLGDKKFV